MKTVSFLYIAVFACLLCSWGEAASLPNIIFLLTDDQDVTANSLDYMPKLNKLLRQGGMEFLNYFVPTGLCCPSRSTIIRGQYCHNTKIWDNGDLNNKTYLSGGFNKAVAEGLENVTIATQMKEAGYETFLIGKYLNGYGDSHASHVPVGWDHWYGMTDTSYFGPHFSVNGKLLKTSKKTYQTDFISNMSLSLLKERNKKKPFFFYMAPFAPHAPSLPAPRHENLFNNFTAPRYPSYNPSDDLQHMKPSWIKHLPPLDSTQLASIDNFYRNRLRALQAVDEMLENVTLYLQEEGIEDNTFIFYMGDNGQHLGDYRLPAGKRQAYDTDIRVPFLVRGPGVKGGIKVTEVVMSIDLLPTWVELANGKLPTTYNVDGKSMVSLLFGQIPPNPQVNTFRSIALAEIYGGSSNMGTRYHGMAGFEKNKFWNNTYQAVRVINGSDWAANANWLYAEWCTGERELYNVTTDPHEIYNIIDKVDPSLLGKLSMVVEHLGSCAGKSCNNMDLKEITDSTSNSGKASLHCYNPPDMPGQSLDDSIWEWLEKDQSLCEVVLSNGFPYSDNDIVSERASVLWESCLKWQGHAQVGRQEN